MEIITDPTTLAWIGIIGCALLVCYFLIRSLKKEEKETKKTEDRTEARRKERNLIDQRVTEEEHRIFFEKGNEAMTIMDIESVLAYLIKTKLYSENIDKDLPLNELYYDRLDYFEFTLALEDFFGIAISDTIADALEQKSFNEIAKEISELKPKNRIAQ